MPYIAKQRRESYLPLLKLIKETRIDAPGELNFLVTKLMLTYLEQHGENYRVLGEVIGTIEAAKAEFVRRKLFPLEQAKCAENGDIDGFRVPGATE